MNQGKYHACVWEGKGERKGGRKEEGSKKGRKDRELWKDKHKHTHTHTGARLDVAEHTEHQVQMPLVYVNKEIF
jgi:hypothetical protein